MNTPPVPDTAQPRLAVGTRLDYDAVRERHVLLIPEGVVALNATAAAVLELCDGERTVAGIVSALEERYDGEDVGDDVRELLLRIAERGLVVDVL
jgi:pyrroloquinoline quinone biosynthesis protein D